MFGYWQYLQRIFIHIWPKPIVQNLQKQTQAYLNNYVIGGIGMAMMSFMFKFHMNKKN